MTNGSYTRKIQRLPDLVEHLRTVRQGKVVVQCHGTFDIVHPGHIRHLEFAKEKGDLLVVSVTCDAFVQKGKDRPYIPEDLRAENLAALEMVDYVYVDYDETPVKAIQQLRPDIFIKGYEYGGHRPDAAVKTADEMDVVTGYGGKMIFSPGDVIFSSSKILSNVRPKVTLEKLTAMFRTQGIGRREVMGALDHFKGARVLIIGDTIIDRYHYCTTLSASTKTPTLSVRRDSSQTFIGGAAIVAQNMANFGADVRFITLVGDDDEGRLVAENLPRENLRLHTVVDKSRPTTRKEVFEAGGYKLLQVDEVDNTPLTGEAFTRVERLFTQLAGEVTTVVFSDFRHGLLHKENIADLVKAARKAGTRVVADTQVSSRWGNILDYHGADLLCATEKETRFALADQDGGIIPLGRRCLVDAEARGLILKLGEKGLIAFEYPHGANKEFYPIDALARDVVDTKGSGDALLSAAALALSSGEPLLITALLASCAAALRVERMGNLPIQLNDLHERVRQTLDAMELQ